MRIARRNLTVVQTGALPTRPALCGIHFEREGSVSSDGVRLAFVPYPEPCAEDDPAIGTLMPFHLAERAARAAGPDDRIDLERSGPDVVVSVQHAKGSGVTTLTGRDALGGGKYPAWSGILPQPLEVSGVALVNPRLMAEALQMLAEAGYGHAYVRVLADNRRPVEIEGAGKGEGGGPGPILLVMPMSTPKGTEDGDSDGR